MLKKASILIAALLLASFAAINSFASFTKSKRPDLSLAMPLFSNGFASEKLSTVQLKAIIVDNDNQFPGSISDDLTSLARRSFLAEPTASEALAIVAFSRPKEVRKELMLKALQISKREQLITGWLITDSAEANNLEDLLQYYDISIRTRGSTANLLLPIMVNALANDDIITPYVKLLQQEPPWAKRFWAIASGQAITAKNSTKLRKRLYNIREDNIYSDDALIRTLTANNHFEEAINLRQFLINNGREIDNSDDINIVTNHDFSSPARYAPIDWQLFSNGKFGATIAKNELLLSAIPNSGNLFARQLIKLNVKSYTIAVALAKPITNGHNLSIELECAQQTVNRLSPIIIPIKNSNSKRQLSNINGLCQYYWLNVRARSSDDQEGLDIGFKFISITPVN